MNITELNNVLQSKMPLWVPVHNMFLKPKIVIKRSHWTDREAETITKITDTHITLNNSGSWNIYNEYWYVKTR
jgi:hypothetical protein